MNAEQREECFKLRLGVNQEPAYLISPKGRRLVIADQSFRSVMDFVEEINGQTAKHKKAWRKLMGYAARRIEESE